MSNKPSIVKGTRDFLPDVMAKRNYIFDTIKTVFEKYGFLPIETPAMEKTETLMGKYGEEGDRLIFRILNSGDYLNKLNDYLKTQIAANIKQIKSEISQGKEVNIDTDHITSAIKSINEKTNFENINIYNYQSDIFPLISRILIEHFEDEELTDKFFNSDDGYIETLADKVGSEFWWRIRPQHLTNWISEKALRYDLTVPFARFVVQNQNELTFPFKRYQIQAVWRADRPQKGRYREFYQCDADVVGTDSLVCEIELVQIFDEVLSNLGIPDFTIKINNRKILSGIAEVCGEEENIVPITVAIDKLDKIGKEGVVKELQERGISESAIKKIDPLFELGGSNKEKLDTLKSFLSESEIGQKGIEELKFVIEQAEALGLQKAKLEFEVTLARGLNYYTGAIFEVSANNVNIGSICGGGRYDDLTALFGLSGMSGVGISFGADRIYDVMEELNLFPESALNKTRVVFINFGEEEQQQSMKYAKQLRDSGISCEVYPSVEKMKKQMKYANDRKIPYVVIIGSEELKNGSITFKNMQSGHQMTGTFNELLAELH
ncbi:MAG: histidine--tRNA ligase [Crocinitomicaceae bacterium]